MRRILDSAEWQDLVAYKPWETAKELSLPLPWFILETWASSNQLYFLALLASVYFFLTCLRVSHNAFHYSIGLSRSATDVVMLLLSVFMMTSMRATQFTHLQHHRHCLGDRDVEGHVAKTPFFEMLLNAPLFTIKLHLAALTQAKQQQIFWVKVELLLNLLWLILVWFCWDSDALKIHTIIMLLSHAISPVFTVWSVHHDCENSDYDSRTLRNFWLSLMAYNMFYHLEHHAYPAIPTCHLAELAKRLDEAGMTNYKSDL
jgi:fatty acid desaturase